MNFIGFTPRDFDTFQIEGLEARMEAIRERIQPKFQALGEALVDDVAMMAGTEMHVHIAKHARRTINAPKDTWMAFSPSKKKAIKCTPTFRLACLTTICFFWLALIYELPLKKKSIAQTYLDHLDEVRGLIPPDYVLSFDHMNKEAVRAGNLSGEQLEEALIRFRDVKKKRSC